MSRQSLGAVKGTLEHFAFRCRNVAEGVHSVDKKGVTMTYSLGYDGRSLLFTICRISARSASFPSWLPYSCRCLCACATTQACLHQA